ncbi:hypothetical protein F5B20DRAFT_577794 [Whalleya microplaca]|nr:hypothetical protein F5B20DRAFT_577794 [Whalleya microplaca]
MNRRIIYRKDLYRRLRVSSTATENDIRKGYRMQCLKYHPDKSGNTPGNHVRFIKVQEAYEVLRDRQSRKEYDEFRRRLAQRRSGKSSPLNSSGHHPAPDDRYSGQANENSQRHDRSDHHTDAPDNSIRLRMMQKCADDIESRIDQTYLDVICSLQILQKISSTFPGLLEGHPDAGIWRGLIASAEESMDFALGDHGRLREKLSNIREGKLYQGCEELPREFGLFLGVTTPMWIASKILADMSNEISDHKGNYWDYKEQMILQLKIMGTLRRT